MQELNRFKSHRPLLANDPWGKDYQDGANPAAQARSNPNQAARTTQSNGKTAEKTDTQPSKQCRKLILPDGDDEETPTTSSNTAALREECQRQEEAARQKDIQTA